MARRNRRYSELDEDDDSRNTRSARAVKEKFSQTPNKLAEFTPTGNQQKMLNMIRENTLTFVEAPAGTGKTTVALYDYCLEYLRDPTKKIMIVRTPVEAASLDKIGFLPNGLEDKIEPHFESTRGILEEFLGKNKVECDLGKRILFKIPNYLLGATIDNTLILIDESQQLQPMILKLILERVGINSRVCVIGDASQLYSNEREAKQRNALSDALGRFLDKDMNPCFPDVGYFTFNVDEDVKRSEIVKTVIKAYRE